MATEGGNTPPPPTHEARTQSVDTTTRRQTWCEKWSVVLSGHWSQIYLISVMGHCWPGALNSISSLGGSGLADQAVAANATVALLVTSTMTALFLAGPAFDRLGPRACVLLGGWTYPLYIGSIFAYNHIRSAAFVIVSGAVLGVGSSLFWVVQGTIITTYVPETQRGRAFATFWVIFNLGGTIASLGFFGSNYHTTGSKVANKSYIIAIISMCLAWLSGFFICPRSKMQGVQLQSTFGKRSWRQMLRLTLRIMSDWKVLCMVPLFFSANAFYPYQQNVVNGQNFTIRARALNGFFYWIAQIVGALLMGLLVDLPKLHRQRRAWIAWTLLFTSGMIIWGGGYAFERWSGRHSAHPELKQPIDFTQGRPYVGPMFLYFFYGMYDAFWQTFCYWLIGTRSNCPTITAVLVCAYKAFQGIGGAMVWRLNAMGTPAMSQFAMNWGLCIGSLLVVLPSVEAVTLTSSDERATDTSKSGSEA